MTSISTKVKLMTVAALLCAIGIMIPLVAPKIIIEPASFTLGSHVAVFIAMFISPVVAISVALITSFGFLLSGFPIVVVLRALSHLIFATIGAYYLKKHGNTLLSLKHSVVFSVVISIIHALAEVAIVSVYYWGGSIPSSNGYLISVIVLVGVGTFIHSLIDFSMAVFVWKPLQYVIHVPANAKIRTK
jgi:niacin transporter